MSNTQIPRRGDARREAWGTAVEIVEGLWRVRLNNPVGALLVNSYVYRSAGHLAVIDPGWPWTLDALEAALEGLGLAASLGEVDQWLYTHTHLDHMGAAALLSRRSDAPHVFWRPVSPKLERWHAFQDTMSDWTAWAREAFFEREPVLELEASTRRRRERGEEFLLPRYGEMAVNNAYLVELGQSVEVGDLSLTALDARGHDPLHVAWWEPSRGWLFSGDTVIATPTPLCRAMGDDLALYQSTLDRLERLPTRLLLPGHGVHRAGEVGAAFARARSYLTQYRAGVLEALEDARTPRGLWQLALAMTPHGQPLEPPGRWIAHLALVDSHLHALVHEERIARDETKRYRIIAR